jgi:hypothetical protein
MFMFMNVLVSGQEKIEYQNKPLKRMLSREGISVFSQISELDITDSLRRKYRIQGKFFEISTDENRYKYIYTGRVNSCRAGGCKIPGETPGDEASEYFDYFILFDRTKSVQAVKVFNYQATHGYEITSRGWLKQFIGYDGSQSLEVSKNIDAISGATISVRAITADVEIKTEILKELKL